MVSMRYTDFIKHIDIEGGNFRLTVKENGYLRKISKKINYNTTLKDLCSEYSAPIIRGYFEAKTKDIYTYSLEFKVSNKAVVLEFDKNTVTVYTPHDGLVLVYKTNDRGLMLAGELIESYHLLDDGFVYTNYGDHTSTLYYNSFKDTIKFCFEIRDVMGSQMLDYLPKRVYQKDNYFNSTYDKDGMTMQCILDEKDDVVYCNYEKEDNKTVSIHPMIFDPFAALYDIHLVDYWVVDTLESVDEDTKVFDRVVYKVLNVYDLLDAINA